MKKPAQMTKIVKKGSETSFIKKTVLLENVEEQELKLSTGYYNLKSTKQPLLYNHNGSVILYEDWAFNTVVKSVSLTNEEYCEEVVLSNFCGDYKTDYMCMNPSLNTINIFEINGTNCLSLSDKDLFIKFHSLKYGDFNGDGVTDFIILNGPLRPSFSFFSNGDNSSLVGRSFRYPTTLVKAYEGDFNGDGASDLCIIHNENALRIYFFDYLGNYTEGRPFPTNHYDLSANNYYFIKGDFNGDSMLDLVHISGAHHSNYFFSNGDGTFLIKRPYPEPSESQYRVAKNGYFISGTFDSPGVDCMLHILHSQVHAWRSMSEGRVHITPSYVTSELYDKRDGLVIVDSNSDGIQDLIVFESEFNEVSIFSSNMCPPISLRTLAGYHGFSYNEILDHRHSKIRALLKGDDIITEGYKIPLLTHYIWVNNAGKSTHLNEDARDILANNFDIFSQAKDSWEHYLWINHSPHHERSIKMFESLGGKIKFIETLPSYHIIKEVVEHSININSFGKASDFLRFTILKDFGGLYLDIDYSVDREITVFNKIFDFYANTENWKGDWLSSSMIASTKSHPIINGALIYSVEFFENINCQYDEKDISIATGPGSISLSYFKYSNIDNNVDVAFPSEIGQSSKNYGAFEEESFDSLSINVDGENLHIARFGVHWLMNTWSTVIDSAEDYVYEEHLETSETFLDEVTQSLAADL